MNFSSLEGREASGETKDQLLGSLLFLPLRPCSSQLGCCVFVENFKSGKGKTKQSRLPPFGPLVKKGTVWQSQDFYHFVFLPKDFTDVDENTEQSTMMTCRRRLYHCETGIDFSFAWGPQRRQTLSLTPPQTTLSVFGGNRRCYLGFTSLGYPYSHMISRVF